VSLVIKLSDVKRHFNCHIHMPVFVYATFYMTTSDQGDPFWTMYNRMFSYNNLRTPVLLSEPLTRRDHMRSHLISKTNDIERAILITTITYFFDVSINA